MITKIIFLRHGKVYNPRNILYGRLPRFPLSDEGKAAIELLLPVMSKMNIDYIYTSPLLRARQTGGIIAKKMGIKPKISKLLIETEELCTGVSLEKFRKEIQPILYDPKFLREGQEGIKSQYLRMKKFTEIVEKRHRGKTILAVSHGDPILIFKTLSSGIEFTYEYKLNNYLQPGNFLILEHSGNKYSWS